MQETALDRRDLMKMLNMITATEKITYEQILFVIASFNCGNGEQVNRYNESLVNELFVTVPVQIAELFHDTMIAVTFEFREI